MQGHKICLSRSCLLIGMFVFSIFRSMTRPESDSGFGSVAKSSSFLEDMTL